MIEQLKDKYPIDKLCATLKCSRSGYYDWIDAGRPAHKAFDEATNDLVWGQYQQDRRQGIVRIRMNLRQDWGVVLSKSTIYRYMRINGIQSIIRKKRHAYGTVEHTRYPNLIKRDFNADRSNAKWSIDISFLSTTQGWLYLCAIKDMHDKFIVAHRMSRFNDNALVFDTVRDALKKVRRKDRIGLILHSDQGSQFTSPVYDRLLKQNHIRHSVSSKGSCVDNSPIESWFSALKVESIYLQDPVNVKEMIELVEEYV
ncbi:MAG: IS3 family transposase [bacterium]